MTDLSLSENAFLAYAAAIPGVNSTSPDEPATLGKLPAVTMLFVAAPAEDRETGDMWVSYTYKVNMYFNLTSLNAAQQQMKSILPQMLAITRRDPHLKDSNGDATCVWADINDRGDEPVHVLPEGYLQKTLYLVVNHYEAIT